MSNHFQEAEIEELIKNIALKHNVALSKDDPLMVLVTIFNFINNETLLNQKKLITEFREEVEAICQRTTMSNHELAEKMIKAVVRASQSAMNEFRDESLETVENHFKRYLNRLDKLENSTDNIRKISILNFTSACLMVVCTIAFIIFS